MRTPRGFTLIELTVVILLVGILSVVAIAKLTGVDEFQVQGFFDSTKATVRFAQKVAVAQRTNVFVVNTASTMRVCYDAACAATVIDPTSGGAMVVTAPAGVSIGGVGSNSFDGLGRASPGGTISVTGAGITHNILIEAATGYVH